MKNLKKHKKNICFSWYFVGSKVCCNCTIFQFTDWLYNFLRIEFSIRMRRRRGSVVRVGDWMRKTRVQIPDSAYWMNLSSVIQGASSPRFVNSQLVFLLPVGILNWERGFLIWHWKAPLGEMSLRVYVLCFYWTVPVVWLKKLDFNKIHLNHRTIRGSCALRVNLDISCTLRHFFTLIPDCIDIKTF